MIDILLHISRLYLEVNTKSFDKYVLENHKYFLQIMIDDICADFYDYYI